MRRACASLSCSTATTHGEQGPGAGRPETPPGPLLETDPGPAKAGRGALTLGAQEGTQASDAPCRPAAARSDLLTPSASLPPLPAAPPPQSGSSAETLPARPSLQRPQEVCSLGASGGGQGPQDRRALAPGPLGGQAKPVPPAAPRRTEFGLDALGSGSDVIRAVRELSYKGGNTRTGAAILHVADHVFLPQLARPGVPKVTPCPSMLPSEALNSPDSPCTCPGVHPHHRREVPGPGGRSCPEAEGPRSQAVCRG